MYGTVQQPVACSAQDATKADAPSASSSGVAATWARPVGVVVMLGVALVAVTRTNGAREALAASNTGLATRTVATTMDLAATISALPVVLSDDYSERNGYSIGEGFYPFENIAEVYRTTTMSLDNLETVEGHASCSFDWAVVPESNTNGEVTSASGSTIELVFNSLGLYQVNVTISCGAMEFMSKSTTVFSSYVRREIRTLTDADRNNFFDALEKVYHLTQSEGEEKYGEDFRSIETLVHLHLMGAADKECDHWHDDAGIMTHHMAFTLLLEQSLQSVTSTVAMPYWDYTYDSYYDSDWVDSEIFQMNWFGNASPDNDNHVIESGRWAYLAIKSDAGSLSSIHNPYGLLRSPWNTNPVPYVTRYRYVMDIRDGGWTLPSCSDFATVFDYNKLSYIIAALNGVLHGPIHIMIGGQWWDKLYDKDVTKNWHLKKALKTVGGDLDTVSDFLLSSKLMWREGKLRCPEVCSKDTPSSSCACSCPSEVYKNLTNGLGDLKEDGIYKINTWLRNSSFQEMSNMSYSDVVDIMCHVGHAGEMFTSAAPYDPIFWPLHGLAERFLSFKRIMAMKNVTKLDATWGYHHQGALASDSHRICDWTNVTGMQLPNCTVGTCPGHRAGDLMPFTVKDSTGRSRLFTNEEFYLFTDPGVTELPYVYDSFTRWPACKAQNISFV